METPQTQSNNKNFTLILTIIAVIIVLILCSIGALAALTIPGLKNAQSNTRDSKRLLELEVIRNALADWYVRYESTPSICLGMEENKVVIVKKDTPCNGSPSIKTDLTTAFKFEQVQQCSSYTGDIIKFIHKPESGEIILCEENGGEEILKYY